MKGPRDFVWYNNFVKNYVCEKEGRRKELDKDFLWKWDLYKVST